MLMTPYRPQASHITDAGNELLALIRDAGDAGTTRPQLAFALGKKRLNMWHEAQLALLESEGYITVATRPNARLSHISEFVYRATNKR